MARKKPPRMSRRQFDRLMREWFERYCDEVAALVAAAAKETSPPPPSKRKPRRSS